MVRLTTCCAWPHVITPQRVCAIALRLCCQFPPPTYLPRLLLEAAPKHADADPVRGRGRRVWGGGGRAVIKKTHTNYGGKNITIPSGNIRIFWRLILRKNGHNIYGQSGNSDQDQSLGSKICGTCRSRVFVCIVGSEHHHRPP